jgi:hypothetical protein
VPLLPGDAALPLDRPHPFSEHSELERMLRQRGFLQAEVTQVAATALQVRRDIACFGAIPCQKHRVYMHVIG